MSVIGEPFGPVAKELVGLLTPSKRGHRYILTLIDCATRFSEAVALCNIETTTVGKSLIDIFCRVGIPKETLSNCGKKLKSDQMNEMNRVLCI